MQTSEFHINIQIFANIRDIKSGNFAIKSKLRVRQIHAVHKDRIHRITVDRFNRKGHGRTADREGSHRTDCTTRGCMSRHQIIQLIEIH